MNSYFLLLLFVCLFLVFLVLITLIFNYTINNEQTSTHSPTFWPWVANCVHFCCVNQLLKYYQASEQCNYVYLYCWEFGPSGSTAKKNQHKSQNLYTFVSIWMPNKPEGKATLGCRRLNTLAGSYLHWIEWQVVLYWLTLIATDKLS